jgi:hypothetical protein
MIPAFRVPRGVGDQQRATRTKVAHERIERPEFDLVVLPVDIGPTNRPGLKVGTVYEVWITGYLGSPLVRRIRS